MEPEACESVPIVPSPLRVEPETKAMEAVVDSSTVSVAPVSSETVPE
jgi:hypothetical protein